MSVYQSVTEPKVEKMYYKEVVPGDMVWSVGKRKLFNWIRRSKKIPARVKPEERMVDNGWEFTFRWFQITTD